MKPGTLDEARSAKAAAKMLFAQLNSVVGIGITRIGDGFGLKVNLREKPGVQLPEEVAGVPIQLEVVGTLAKR